VKLMPWMIARSPNDRLRPWTSSSGAPDISALTCVQWLGRERGRGDRFC